MKLTEFQGTIIVKSSDLGDLQPEHFIEKLKQFLAGSEFEWVGLVESLTLTYDLTEKEK